MKPLELANRDTTGELIAFVKFETESFFCMAEVEYWIGVSWFMHIKDEHDKLELQYFNYLKKFKLDYQELNSAYEQLNLNDVFEREGNKPCVYIDFEKKYFASYFQEQELEARIPDGWKGEYKNVSDLIPEKYKYWEPRETSSL